jgi:hypothetical protein
MGRRPERAERAVCCREPRQQGAAPRLPALRSAQPLPDARRRLAAARRLVRLVALSLGLPADHFVPSFTPPVTVLRPLRYAPVRSDPAAGLLGCGAHTDYGMVRTRTTRPLPAPRCMPLLCAAAASRRMLQHAAAPPSCARQAGGQQRRAASLPARQQPAIQPASGRALRSRCARPQLTVLATDEVPGLQALFEGAWVDVDPVQGGPSRAWLASAANAAASATRRLVYELACHRH